MTVEATSIAAYNSLLSSGADVTQREIVRQVIERHGPLAEFEVAQFLPDMKLTSFRARRRELNKQKIIGIMPFRRSDPDTGKEAFVWGSIERHGAAEYQPDDTIAIRVKGETRTLKFAPDDLATMPASVLGQIIVNAISELEEQEG